ncbi:ACT domain-containing protein ACR10-like isoform X1 [Zingiber officinale]|uniref:ACT domain-containing protein ACR10-like isoform X1 n=1 Tax=Zingiber officinale TaxID=94328 RepID=UPI001C4B54B1|nr:ACT domain-containing protein ACR10-like isoform X1 [Zingiber officinale]
MGMPSDEVVIIRPPERPEDPILITVSCPDKTGLGCNLCRVILLFGLSVVRGDFSTDGRWCYVVFWVVDRGRKATRWNLLKKRLVDACPPASLPFGNEIYYFSKHQEMITEQKPQVFLLKFSCYDRTGLLHDVTEVLCELELTIWRVKVSTTPDGRVVDLFLITDPRELLHTKNRQEETCVHLRAVLGDSMCTCDVDVASEEFAAYLQASASLPPPLTEDMLTSEVQHESYAPDPSSSFLSVSVDNALSHAHSLIQIQCHDHKGLLYDIMRTLKDYNMQISYGRFNAAEDGNCNIDLFAVQKDGKKIADQNKQNALCSRLRMQLSSPLCVTLVSRGPDTELLVANPVELCGKGRPLVFYDITHALKMLDIRIFLAEIGRHVVGDREWEVYRVHLGDDQELCASRDKIVKGVTKMLMGWH